MSLASKFMKQLRSKRAAEYKLNLIEDLIFWADSSTPLYVMGQILDGEEKVKFMKELKELVRQEVKVQEHNIEIMFWMYCISDVYDLKIAANTREKRLAKFLLNKCANDSYYGIEDYIRMIRLI